MNQDVSQRLFIAAFGLFAIGTIATRASAASSDQAFVDSAYRANNAEVAQARYMLKHTKNAKTRQYAQMMIDDHSTANVKLLSAARTADVTSPAKMAMPVAMMAPPELQGLSGMALDRAYFTQAVADHKQALQLFTTEAMDGTAPSLKTYASDTVPTVRKHLDYASEWVASGGKEPAMMSSGPAPASAAPAAPLQDVNGPLQSAAPTVQESATANPQPTSTSVVATPLPTHTPGPP